ncbi:MAG: hypothetical protein JO197_14130 [Acidobacteria bacterium]|nr:hypothetical protein [Acidobacteriota bacterium]MBV9478683.1 hypothetical protein [Acidobacteriota bacterium]
MGAALWLGCGVLAFLVARIVPFSRRPVWLPELAVSLVISVLLGLVATALDLGGWREPDWRAAAFAGFGALAAIGLLRLATRPTPH